MANERLIPTQASPSVSTFTVLSDGEVVSGTHQILSIIVQLEVNRVPSATLIVRDGNPAAQTFESSNTNLFIPGRQIEIKAGYRGTEDTIFKGVVVSHSIKVRNQKSSLMVLCKDESFKMTIGCKNRYFRDQTDSDVLEEIIQQNGLQSAVQATTLQYGEIVQYNTTDWDFVLMRAELNGFVCIVENGKLIFAPPDFQQAEQLTLQYGATLLEFDAELDARNQYKSTKSIAWASADQSIVEGEATTVNIIEAGNISSEGLADVHGEDPFQQFHTGNLSEAELQDWAKACLLKSKLSKILGRAKFQGIAEMKPGQLVKLQGVGERFEGKVYVSGVRHEISNGNWTVDAQIGMNPEWFAEQFEVQKPLASGLIPPISGLQIGVVTQLESDPKGEHRIMVRMPVISESDEGIWARVATLDAGDNRGSFFLPEVGDEVVTGFLNNDPRHPVVLGGLNSSAKPAPLDATDDNHEKGFVTRSGIKWIFNDDKKEVLLQTPDGNKVLVSGEEQGIQIEDQNGNKLTLDSNGITLESATDITLKANGMIKAEGLNIECKASTSATLEGNASATIKGGVVQIN